MKMVAGESCVGSIRLLDVDALTVRDQQGVQTALDVWMHSGHGKSGTSNDSSSLVFELGQMELWPWASWEKDSTINSIDC